MPVSDQGLTRERYMLIPRTAIFLRKADSYLLLKGAPNKRLWANQYNGLGGHVEPGEDVLSAARRELFEESGLSADLWLCGTLIVDTGQNPGICLYIFTGEAFEDEPKPSAEGMPEWIPFGKIRELPLVEDVPVILERIHQMKRGASAFAARSFYDDQQRLTVIFTD